MAITDPTATRRAWLLRAGVAIAAAPVALAAASAKAAANTPKSAVNYRYQPNGAQHCGACSSFIPGADAQGPGTCKIVEGPIPQNGWCELYSKR
jgi:hypothetical protein